MSESKVAKNTAYLVAAFVGQKILSFVYFTIVARAGHACRIVNAPAAEKIVIRGLRLTQRARAIWISYTAERAAVRHIMVMRLARPRRSRGRRL